MTEYDPAALAAIRQARADLYEAQAARRRIYLQTGRWAPQLEPRLNRPAPREGEPAPPPAVMVDMQRAELDTAREIARATATPTPPPMGKRDADL